MTVSKEILTRRESNKQLAEDSRLFYASRGRLDSGVKKPKVIKSASSQIRKPWRRSK